MNIASSASSLVLVGKECKLIKVISLCPGISMCVFVMRVSDEGVCVCCVRGVFQ